MTTVPAHRSTLVYLTGFMGSGKSTIGPIVANTIGYEFVDLDGLIEADTGKTIAQIFREVGEPSFRALERRMLGTVTTRSRLVVALGGGVVTDPESLALVSSTGIMVYLRATAEDIAARLRRKTDRPLILGEGGVPLSDDALLERIRILLAEREPLYRTADITVESDSSRLGLTVDLVVRRLAPYLSHPGGSGRTPSPRRRH
jgi:shikimate kinase